MRALTAVLCGVVLILVVVRPDVADALATDDEPRDELHPTYLVGPDDVTVDFISATAEPHELTLDVRLIEGAPLEVLLVPVEAVSFPDAVDGTQPRGLVVDDSQALERFVLETEERIVLLTAPGQMYGLVLRGDPAHAPPPAEWEDGVPPSSGVGVVLGYPREDVLGARVAAYVMMLPGLVLLGMLAVRDLRGRRAVAS